MHLPENTLLQGGKYRIRRFINSGGFGCTYEAENVMLQARVAIKELFVSDFCQRNSDTGHVTLFSDAKQPLFDKLRRKFVDEARALASLRHPGIVRVVDIFEENGTSYYVMDYIDGYSLRDLVKSKGALHEAEVLPYIRQAADALQYVHNNKRLHLDIKPANIMVDDNGKVILIDFGVSKQYDEASGENTSTLMGYTRGYAPLEQMGGNVKTFTPATDIYAMGATLYELLVGSPPPEAVYIIKGLPIEPLQAQGVSNTTIQAIRSAMQSDKSDRPQSVADLLALINNKSNGGATNVTDDSKTRYTDKDKTHYKEPDEVEKYQVGDYYDRNGIRGVVFEVSDGGRHGKVLSMDRGETHWRTDFLSVRTRASSEGDGKSNTDIILSRSDRDKYPAFTWCRNKGSNWYLPSREELLIMYRNKEKINATLSKHGGTTLSGWYWSSTESGGWHAWGVLMSNGLTDYYNKNYDNDYVRAAVAF